MCMMLQIDVVHVVQVLSVTAGSNCDLQFLPYQQQDTDGKLVWHHLS